MKSRTNTLKTFSDSLPCTLYQKLTTYWGIILESYLCQKQVYSKWDLFEYLLSSILSNFHCDENLDWVGFHYV